jgi:putative transposase
MGATYVNMNFHLVFSVKKREKLITPNIQRGLYQAIHHVIQREKGVLNAIGGASDHVHLLIGWHPNGTIADLMREIKAKSSGWARRQSSEKASFRWQRGYSVFSVSETVKENVADYIRNQEQRHQNEDYGKELRILLKKHNIIFDSLSEFDEEE